MAGIWGLVALRLADDPILPFNYISYATELQVEEYFTHLHVTGARIITRFGTTYSCDLLNTQIIIFSDMFVIFSMFNKAFTDYYRIFDCGILLIWLPCRSIKMLWALCWENPSLWILSLLPSKNSQRLHTKPMKKSRSEYSPSMNKSCANETLFPKAEFTNKTLIASLFFLWILTVETEGGWKQGCIDATEEARSKWSTDACRKRLLRSGGTPWKAMVEAPGKHYILWIESKLLRARLVSVSHGLTGPSPSQINASMLQ